MISDRFERINPKTGYKSKIIFWMDPKKEFSDDIDNIQLPDVSVIRWNGFNSFSIKERIECEEPDSKFLIYMPGEVPGDQTNILADMMHYSKPLFFADNASCICQEMDISERFKDTVQKHIGFFKTKKNRDGFEKYGPFDSEGQIHRAMLAVLLSSDDNTLDSIVTRIICDYSEIPSEEGSDEILAPLEKFDLTETLWNLCSKEYGFTGDSMEELVSDLFITAAFDSSTVSTSPKLSKYILPKRIPVIATVNHILDDREHSESIVDLCRSISDDKGIGKVLEAFDNMNDLVECEVFPCVDSAIVSRLIERIISTRSPLGDIEIEHVHRRMKTRSGRNLISFYESIASASELIGMCIEFNNRLKPSDAKAIIDSYVNVLYRIDTLYREFISSSDDIPSESDVSEDLVKELKDYVENTYCNIFLDPIVSDLCSLVGSYNDLPAPYQQDFCRKYISEKEKKTVIIISDAFRYECAAELCNRLKANPRVERCKLDHMISTVPSKTSFGMAALLPNDGLMVNLKENGDFTVLIDGQMTESSMRETILQSRYPDSAVLKYDQFNNTTGKELRGQYGKKRLLYIYHDTIDKTGESDERNVFSACQRAIYEISELIKIVTNWNYTRFIVTSDHGFIYRRSEIKEYEKISTMNGFNSKRRFALNDRPFNLDRCVEFPLDYLGEGNKGLYVSVPNSTALFRHQGEAKCFAHEGISPQEIVVPVLTVTTQQGKLDEKYVGLKPSNKHEIKSFRPTLELWQEHPVDSEYHKHEYEIWLEDENEQCISQIYTVFADKDDPSDLKHRLKMTEDLKQDSIILVIRSKGESDVQRYEGFRVRRVASI